MGEATLAQQIEAVIDDTYWGATGQHIADRDWLALAASRIEALVNHHESMYERVYSEIVAVLNEFGAAEDDGAGLAGDVRLLAQREQVLRWLHAEAVFERNRLQDELDGLHSWQGLMSILDEHWPAEVFKGSHEDPGPTIVFLLHEVDRLRREVEFEAKAEPWTPDSIVAPEGHGYVNGGNRCQCGLSTPSLRNYADHVASLLNACACISDDQASQLGPGFTRPACAVHLTPSDLQVPPSLGDAESDWCNCQAIPGSLNYPGPWHPVGNSGASCAATSGTSWAEGGEPE